MRARAERALQGAALFAAVIAGIPAARAEEKKEDLTAEVDRCAARQADADVLHRRALEHYDRGAVYYEQGEYEAAVAEFLTSYCDEPHPETLFNIGQSYERMLEYETAVAYFERFIRDSEPGSRNVRRAQVRVRVLRRLEARVSVATVPKGANVSLLRDKTLMATGVANSDKPITVQGGTYTLRVEMDGYEPRSETVDLSIGEPWFGFFQLEKKKGTLRIQTSPKSARVFVDDRLVGFGGNHTETLPVGRYKVRAEAENREPVEREVEITEGRFTEEVIRLSSPPRSGRWELIAAGTFLGLVAGSLSIAETDLNDTVKSAFSLGGSALAFGGALIAVPRDIPVGYSSYIITSALAGTVEGLAIGSLIFCDAEPEFDCSPSGAVAGVAAGGMIAGFVGSAATASRFKLSAGDAAILNSGFLWGSAFGLLFFANFDERNNLLAPLTLGGLNLGLATGAILGSRVEVSRRRVALIDLAGIGGGISGFAAAQALDASDEQVANVALVGITAGLIVGTYLTRYIDEPDATNPLVTPATGAVSDARGRRTTTWGARVSF